MTARGSTDAIASTGGYPQIRLGASTLEQLPIEVMRPAYPVTETGVGLVHLGLGAFHRAHQAVYNDDVMALHGGDWRTIGVSLRSTQVRDTLRPQNGLYTVGVRSGGSEHLRVIGSLADVLVAPENPKAVIDAMASPSVNVITLTVTEKGYCLSPSTGELDFDHPDVQHDLTNRDNPRSALGFICAALEYRAACDLPVNIISCDNLADNGRKLQHAVEALLAEWAPKILPWVRGAVAFPCTMVDRIVPAVETSTVEATAEAMGVYDAACVKTEPFSQWVIENAFSAPRPRWEDVGALVVDDVACYESNKLRLLNGAHSALAYVGLLCGHRFVHEAATDPIIARFIARFMDYEILPELNPPTDFDLSDYAAKLRIRFNNPGLPDALARIATDGSQKIPQRWLGVLRQRLSLDKSVNGLCFALVSWALVMGRSAPLFNIEDPLANTLRQAVTAGGGELLAVEILALETVLGADLVASDAFKKALLSTCEMVSNLDYADVMASICQ